MDVVAVIKPFLPYISQVVVTVLMIGLILLKTFSREREILSRIDKLSADIEKLSSSMEKERERTHHLEVKLAEKYLSVDRWLEINNKFEASVKHELTRIHRSLEKLNEILIEVLKDGGKTG